MKVSNQTSSLSNRCNQTRRISDKGKDVINITLRTLLKNTFSFKDTVHERECNRFIIDSREIDSKIYGYRGVIPQYIIPAFIDKISDWYNPSISISNRVHDSENFMFDEETEFDDYVFTEFYEYTF